MSTDGDTSAWVALLRGINVGGKNRLLMKDLAAMFVEVGCDDVRTYIQSGNVVFGADPVLAAEVPSRISASIRDRFGYEIPIVTRRASDLDAIVEANPFVASGAETDRLHVLFLADAPAAEQVEALDPDRSPGDEFAVRGREIYLHYPNGTARSKLTNAWFDSRLSTVSTMRNWKTVRKLIELTADVP
jgi:uncharacterized protein (DUF1697 family)